MKDELWRQISEIFQSALKLEPNARDDYLEEACGDRAELQDQVRSLLNAYDAADDSNVIDVSAAGLASRFLIDEDSRSGEIVGPYRIVRRLGAGGMGEVYLAEDTTLGRLAAIKFLLTETAQNKERIHRFLREARAASALNHPNILTVHQVGNHDGSHFIATEFIDGKTLRDRLQRGSLPLIEVLDIASQIAVALDSAHAAGIIHRDIKPENIMIRDDGLVKILDFGIAKLLGPSADTVEFTPVETESETRDQLSTKAGTIMGTAAYMSPEQGTGSQVDARTDIWSLGVLIYEMVSGRQPFRGTNAAATIAEILKSDPPPLNEAPQGLQEIVARSLKKDLHERYQGVGSLLSDLKALRQDLDFAQKLELSGASTATLGRISGQTHEQRRSTASGVSYIAQGIKDHRYLTAAAIAFVAISGAVLFYFASDSFGTRSTSRIGSIAVLPLVNGTGSAEIEYLSDGLTDSLINSLSRVPDLTVKARSSVFQYKSKEVSPQTIGDELSVQAALLGRVTKLGDVLTLSLELVDTKSGDRIWGESYNRKQNDLVSLQNEITRDVVAKLGARLTGTHEQSLAKGETTDPEAYRLYLQGLYYLNKRTAEDIRKSIRVFEQATEKDPTYAKAWASIASAYIILRVYNAGLSRDEVKNLTVKAREAVDRAKELNESLPEVHAILGSFSDASFNFSVAAEEYQRAIELNPNDATAHLSYCLNLSWRGRYDEAISEINRAYEIDPLSRSIAFNVGARLAEAHRFDEAIAQYKRVLDMEPDHPLTHWLLAAALDAKGRHAEAIPEHRAADVLLERESAENADKKAEALIDALKTGGAEGYWRKRLEFSRQDYEKGRGLAYHIAIIHARLGEWDQTFEQLEKSVAGRELYLPWIGTESAFDPIADDPRFRALLVRLGLREA